MGPTVKRFRIDTNPLVRANLKSVVKANRFDVLGLSKVQIRSVYEEDRMWLFWSLELIGYFWLPIEAVEDHDTATFFNALALSG